MKTIEEPFGILFYTVSGSGWTQGWIEGRTDEGKHGRDTEGRTDVGEDAGAYGRGTEWQHKPALALDAACFHCVGRKNGHRERWKNTCARKVGGTQRNVGTDIRTGGRKDGRTETGMLGCQAHTHARGGHTV